MKVTCNFQGRLGNLLYEVAHVLALGWRNDAEIVFCTEHEKGYYNDQPSYVDYIKHIIKDYPLIERAEGFKVIQENVREKPQLYTIKENTQLRGYWTSSDYWDDYRGKIIQVFTRKEQGLIDDLVRQYRKRTDKPIIGVHVRRTDYVSEYGWGLGLDYYGRAYQRTKNEIGNCKYLIFSDDKDWCMNNLYFMQDREAVSERDFVEMQLMGRFDGLIMANSTFSAWGAILGNQKYVIAPDVWRDTKGGFDPYNEYIYEKHWIRL